jgi:hypothetical protein
MKIFYYAANSGKLINLGGKIKISQLNLILNQGSSILIRTIKNEMQYDFRIRKVPQQTKRDRREVKVIKEYYLLSVEVGKEHFDEFIPKKVMNEQTFRFRSLERAINMLQEKQNIKKDDWIIFEK